MRQRAGGSDRESDGSSIGETESAMEIPSSTFHYNEADAVELDLASFNTAKQYLKLGRRRDSTFRDQRCWVAYTLQCNQHVDCRWKAKFAGVGETVWQMENGISHSHTLSPRYLNKKHRERCM